jgi:hypothetical protein
MWEWMYRSTFSSALVRGEWSASRPCRFTLGKELPPPLFYRRFRFHKTPFGICRFVIRRRTDGHSEGKRHNFTTVRWGCAKKIKPADLKRNFNLYAILPIFLYDEIFLWEGDIKSSIGASCEIGIVLDRYEQKTVPLINTKFTESE